MKATFMSRFTPSLMKPEDLEAVFVQREDLATRIVELVRESALTGSKHHSLLIGPRGIGKTHLAAIVYHRVRAMDDLRDKLVIAWLREEEWGITSFLDLLLRVLRALVDKDDGLAERVESLYQLDADEAQDKAAGLLKDFVRGRALFLIVENLDDLFEGLGDEGQKRLRAYLQENPFCTILATVQSLFNGVSLQTSPFYGFFRVEHLGELSFDEGRELLRKIATLHGDDELASFIESPRGRARVRALHHLAGGNHRVYVMFSDFVTRQSLDELVDPVLRTLDDLTPYYHARMSRLSPQQRKIVEFLCDRRGAVPVKELAERCFISQQTASSQLATLRELGYVQSEPVGRQSYYELREVLMRLCMEVKKQRGDPVRLFVEFLRSWYTPTELAGRLTAVSVDAELERECLRLALLQGGTAAEAPWLDLCLRDHMRHVECGDWPRALQTAEECVEVRGSAEDWLEQGSCQCHLDRSVEALASFDEALKLDATCAEAWYCRGSMLLRLRRHKQAVESFGKAMELGMDNALVRAKRGRALQGLGREQEALGSFDEALALEPKNAAIWDDRGRALRSLGRYEEALASLDKALELNPGLGPAWANRGAALSDLGRHDEALVSFDRATELDEGAAWIWTGRGRALGLLRRHEEALVSFDKALRLDPRDACAMCRKALSLSDLGRKAEALACLNKVVELLPQCAKAWTFRALRLTVPGQMEEALASYAKALELDPGIIQAWRGRALTLGALGHHEQALEALENAIQLGDDSSGVVLHRSECLLALGRWPEAISSLDEALKRLGEGSAAEMGDASAIAASLLDKASDADTWRSRVRDLIEVYQKHKALPALGQGLVRSISALMRPTVSDGAARMWCDVWHQATRDCVELRLALRLLDAAVRYREAKDPRILLELPAEERKLLEGAIEGAKDAEAS